MDDYQIPTVDGRYLTVGYDEQSHSIVIQFPPPEEGEEDQELHTYGFEPEDAERFVAALDALRARMAGDGAG